MLHALKLYNNQLALDKWEKETVKKSMDKESPKFIALLTKMEKKIEKLRGRPQLMPAPTPNDDKKPKRMHGHPAWKFDNPDNNKMMEWSDQTFRWCSNNCHLCSMWFTMQNCMDRGDYKNKMSGTESNNRGNPFKASKDFRVALSALVLDD
eukprot:15229729-Ditylum_brightwellii.AAC.1